MSKLSGITLDRFEEVSSGYTNRYLENRNNIKDPQDYKTTSMMVETATTPSNYIWTVTKDLEKTPLSSVMFSQKNIDYLQQQIKAIVKKESGHIIGNQSVQELLIIMKSYYLSHGKNLPYDIERQIAELNYMVLKYAVFDQILPKVKGYSTFLNDNLRTNVHLGHEKYINTRGSKINRGFADLI